VIFGTHDLALFALTVLVVNATPGVDMAFTLVATLQRGVRGGLAAAGGVASGCVVHALAATFGLAALMAASAMAFQIVKWVGAAYLLWLAVGMLRAGLHRGGGVDGSIAAAAAPVRAIDVFRRGFLTNVLNPKVAMFFLALLPQFIDGDAADKTMAFLFLGAWFVLQGFVFLALFVGMVAPLRRWQPRPAVVRTLHVAGAGLFATLAARLALTPSP